MQSMSSILKCHCIKQSQVLHAYYCSNVVAEGGVQGEFPSWMTAGEVVPLSNSQWTTLERIDPLEIKKKKPGRMMRLAVL